MSIETPWGRLKISDAHVHFFSHAFFAALAAQKGAPLESLGPALGWEIPDADPAVLAAKWVDELDRHGVDRAVLIASVPGDQDSVAAAVRNHPDRFWNYVIVNPADVNASEQVRGAAGICLFPAMHRYSLHDERVTSLIEEASARVVFVHCGVLSVGVRRKLGLPSLFDMRFSNPIDLHSIALRYPQHRFVVPHFGAGYLREALMLCDLCPNVYLDTSSSNSWMRYEGLDLPTVFRRALEVAGPTRLIFGTDSSFFPRRWNASILQAQVSALHEAGVDARTAQMVFNDNLQSLFAA